MGPEVVTAIASMMDGKDLIVQEACLQILVELAKYGLLF
jgi:hypothetical protein